MTKKKLVFILIVVFILIITLSFIVLTVYSAPKEINKRVKVGERVTVGKYSYTLGNNWLRQNKWGNWECYIEGSAYERGLVMGELQKELIKSQESAFVAELKRVVPNAFFRSLLQLGIAWFNRNLPESVPQEFLEEIYGVSKSFSEDFDFVGPKYNRVLNYHAAHDIGHMAQNMNLVACTAIAKWNFEGENEKLLHGRNFDFYFGDDFAKDKIILFCNPEKGLNFISVSWGGLCGVVSAMNEKGLSVTLNALPSEMPTMASTPVSILAREVVQYATTIEEAYRIIAEKKVFVSESFTIASALDKKAVVIEKTPDTTDIYYPKVSELIVTNHYQGDVNKNGSLNKEHILNSESMARYRRMEELSQQDTIISSKVILDHLRDKNGVGDSLLGMGNPMAIDQLLAHHAVIFDPVEKNAYISVYPYLESVLTAYDISDIEKMRDHNPLNAIAIDSLNLPSDPFLESESFSKFNKYKVVKKAILREVELDIAISSSRFDSLIDLNPDYYEPYFLAGNYYYDNENNELASSYYNKARRRKIPYKSDADLIDQRLLELK